MSILFALFETKEIYEENNTFKKFTIKFKKIKKHVFFTY